MVAALVPIIAVGPAAADDALRWNKAKLLSIDTFHQVILDEANEQLFLRGTDEVFVADYNGKKLANLRNLGGDGLMALSEDGATLWVALAADHEIVPIATATLTAGTAIALPDTICPTSVAETNGKLAVGHDCDGGAVGIGTIDLSNDEWTDSTDTDLPEDEPIVATSPGAADTVVAGDRNATARIRVFDISTGDPVSVAGTQRGTDLHDVAINPDGDIVVMAADSQSNLPAFNTADLSPWKTYKAEASMRALSWTDDGSVLAAGSGEAGADVHLYKRGVKQAKLTHEVDGEVAPRGVAIDAAAQAVWVVSEAAGEFFLTRVTGLGWGRCGGRYPTIIGTDGDDTINGTSGDDVIKAGAGNDVVDGRDGNDAICTEQGEDTITAGSGDDFIDGGAQRDLLTFENAQTPFGVEVDLSARTATGYGTKTVRKIENVIGTQGDDTLIGDGNVNNLQGGPGDDVISGLGNNDTLSGGPDLDFIEGGFGNDKIYGDPGDDLLLGDGGNDTILGGAGNDTMAGLAGDDTLNGGTGADTASFAASPTGITASLVARTATGEGNDKLKSIEWIVGSEQNDTLVGSARVNLLESRGGNDTVRGLDGNDSLNGGEGFDTLHGGDGNDVCLFGESHTSCETIDTGAGFTPAWAAAVWEAAQIFLPQTPME
jgi:Ca2+-binding RTX toxin-like protein